MVELVDTQDLKSCSPKREYGFDSRLGHIASIKTLINKIITRVFVFRGNDEQKATSPLTMPIPSPNLTRMAYLCCMDKRSHWDHIYRHKTPAQLSWTQETPATSLDFIDTFRLPRNARIIDIGGGESRLAELLLEKGYKDITVLDISEEAIKRAQDRLGEKAALVQWIVADIADYEPPHPYDLWHDRATFHFLTTAPQVSNYLDHARTALPLGGYLVIGTFSDKGPDKCSGLPVHRYTEETLSGELHNGFNKIKCITEDHETPFHTVQNFLFCSFKRA